MQNLPRISKQFQPMQRIPTKTPTVQKPCIDRASPEFSGLHNKKRTPNLAIWRSKFGAPPGTRTLGPLIKRNQRATIINFRNYANSSFLAFCRKLTFCIRCILCTCCSLLHPLSSRSGVQKVCKNVQSQNQPLKTGIGFLCKAGKSVGFEPKMAAAI